MADILQKKVSSTEHLSASVVPLFVQSRGAIAPEKPVRSLPEDGLRPSLSVNELRSSPRAWALVARYRVLFPTARRNEDGKRYRLVDVGRADHGDRSDRVVYELYLRFVSRLVGEI